MPGQKLRLVQKSAPGLNIAGSINILDRNAIFDLTGKFSYK